MESFQELVAVGPDFALKFLAVLICGGLIGLEREIAGKSAGLRTNLLICLGAMLFTVASFRMSDVFGGDSTRIAAQIVTGVGFLGAGVIMHNQHGGIKGLTTSALIWAVAAIGMLIGSGFVWTAAAVTAGSLVIATGLNPLEMYIINRRARTYRVTVPADGEEERRVAWLLQEHDEEIPSFITDHDTPNEVVFTFRFHGEVDNRRKLLEEFYRIDGAQIQTGKRDGTWMPAGSPTAGGPAGGEDE